MSAQPRRRPCPVGAGRRRVCRGVCWAAGPDEGFGIPVLEAFQHGKTLAVSRTSSLKEVGGKAAVYFDPEETGAISKSIDNLYYSEMHRSELESLIEKQLESFQNKQIIDKYLSIYSQLAQSLSGH